MFSCDLRVLVRKLASPFGHLTQVSTQVQLASICYYYGPFGQGFRSSSLNFDWFTGLSVWIVTRKGIILVLRQSIKTTLFRKVKQLYGILQLGYNRKRMLLRNMSKTVSGLTCMHTSAFSSSLIRGVPALVAPSRDFVCFCLVPGSVWLRLKAYIPIKNKI